MNQQPENIISRLDAIEALLHDAQNKPLSMQEAAEYLHVSKSYLYKLTSANRIPYYKPTGKLVYFDKKELDAWILHNRIRPQSEIEDEGTNYVTLGRSGRND